MIEPSAAVTRVVNPDKAVAFDEILPSAVVNPDCNSVESEDSELIVPSAKKTLVSNPPIAEALAARFVSAVLKSTSSEVISLAWVVIELSVAVTRVVNPLTAVALVLIADVFVPRSTITLSKDELRFVTKTAWLVIAASLAVI